MTLLRQRPAMLLAMIVLALLAGACAAGRSALAAETPKKPLQAPITILISIDGFRAAYLRSGNSPTLDALADSGLSGSLRPSFPSITFPNHYAMVTGKLPDNSGIVANAMEDPARPGRLFTPADQKGLDDPFWWAGAEPIWVTAEKQGIRTATMFWPGSTAPIAGTRPSDWRAYDKAMPSDQRVDVVIDWLRRPADTRPRFITLYFDEVDSLGHEYGPDAPETAAAIGRVDHAIARLLAALKEAGVAANLVIVADHGMASIDKARTVDLDTFATRADYRIIQGGPFTTIAPAPGKEAAVAMALTGRHGNMTCWPKAAVPKRFHYGTNPRVPPIVCLADFGWQISQGPPTLDEKGAHGFDPGAPDLAALFIGHGPAFPRPAAMRKTDNVNVYPLLAKLIGVTPLANDGSPKSSLADRAFP